MGFFDRDDQKSTPDAAPEPAPDSGPALDTGDAGAIPADQASRLAELRDTGMWTSDLSIDELLLLRRAGFEPLGLVVGSSIYHIGLQTANWSQNQELQVLTQAMYHARELALSRMDQEAATLTADGVVGVRLNIGRYEWGADLAEFLAFGTAVRRVDSDPTAPRPARPFTCLGRAQEIYKIRLAGLMPVGVVMGSCVYHVAHQSLRQALRNVARNTEMPNYTQALYEARELAMERLQHETRQLGGRGVLDVSLREGSHGWGSHVIEFFAIGTAVKPAEPLTDQPTIGLNVQIG